MESFARLDAIFYYLANGSHQLGSSRIQMSSVGRAAKQYVLDMGMLYYVNSGKRRLVVGQPSTTTEGANHGASSISDISMNAQDGPRRPKLQKYPPCMFGVQQRSFCKSWLEQFAWLEYNVTKMADRIVLLGSVLLLSYLAGVTAHSPVHFYAAHPRSIWNGRNQIIYSDVILNEGDAFSGNSGFFTAPVDGIYQFFFSFQSCRGGQNNAWWLRVNGQDKVLCHSQVGLFFSVGSSCSYTASLKRGNAVSVRQDGGCSWATPSSRTIVFSGSLLDVLE